MTTVYGTCEIDDTGLLVDQSVVLSVYRESQEVVISMRVVPV